MVKWRLPDRMASPGKIFSVEYRERDTHGELWTHAVCKIKKNNNNNKLRGRLVKLLKRKERWVYSGESIFCPDRSALYQDHVMKKETEVASPRITTFR